MLMAAKQISYEVDEWRGKSFPYRSLHEKFMELIGEQYLTTSRYDIFEKIGEAEVVGFLNNYYRWFFEDEQRLTKELYKNDFNLSNNDRKAFEEFIKHKPAPCRDPLDIAGYLHMCRIAYDAAPNIGYPHFFSDSHVVALAKQNSCGLENKFMHERMKVGDSVPMFMSYHPEEMGFGGPIVCFEWNDEGWIMTFVGKGKRHPVREVNMDMLRFLAMRRAGYPVEYRARDY